LKVPLCGSRAAGSLSFKRLSLSRLMFDLSPPLFATPPPSRKERLAPLNLAPSGFLSRIPAGYELVTDQTSRGHRCVLCRRVRDSFSPTSRGRVPWLRPPPLRGLLGVSSREGPVKFAGWSSYALARLQIRVPPSASPYVSSFFLWLVSSCTLWFTPTPPLRPAVRPYFPVCLCEMWGFFGGTCYGLRPISSGLFVGRVADT